MADQIEVPIQNTDVLRERMMYVWQQVNKAINGGPVVVKLMREKRTLDQNAKLWAMLTDVSKQVEWYGRMLAEEDWKHVFTAAQYKQDAVPGIEGGFVVLGKSTSKMTKRPFAELIELIYAFGAERDVQWSEKATTVYEFYREYLETERAKEERAAA